MRKHLYNNTIHKLFEDHVEKSPNNIALIFDNTEVTYVELNHRANALANQLMQKGVKSEDIVAIALDRSINMIVSIIAILKAGAAYLPIDPYYPAERIIFILQDCSATFLISENKFQKDIHKYCLDLKEAPSVINIDRVVFNNVQNIENPELKIRDSSLAYIIYTSGSTGKPKGVMVEHAQVTRLFMVTQELYGFNEQDRWPLFHSVAFDVSVWEIFGALFNGGCLVIVPYTDTRDPDMFYQIVVKHRITVLNQTPSAFDNFIIADQHADVMQTSLRYVIFAGEALNIHKLKPWWEKYGDKAPLLVNMYGTTETTVHATYYPLSINDLSNTNISPIGKPLSDLAIYILDYEYNELEIDRYGEVYIGGAGVTRGYLNRVELTNERFISNTRINKYTGKLYKTGDMAKKLADGSFSFLGRADNQVKIRGFRVEIGEIENYLLRHPSVQQTIVITRSNTTSSALSLVAYVVLKDRSVPHNTVVLQSFLKQFLPEYMIPSAIVYLKTFPLTAHGKIDKTALPPPTLDSGRTVIPPRNPLEENIREIFANVLQQNSRLISIDDDFFAIGGDSLLAIQIILNCRQQLNIEVPVHLLFVAPTVKELTEKLSQSTIQKNEKMPTMHPIKTNDRYASHPLSFAQQRLWFLQQLEPQNSYYNVFLALKLEGVVNESALESAFVAIIKRHEILRTQFVLHKDKPYQRVLPSESINFILATEDFSGLKGEQLSNEAYTEAKLPFDLEKAPLFRVRLLKQHRKKYLLFLCLHHIVIDGWSMHVLFKELSKFYNQYCTSNKVRVPRPKLQYLDFSIWQRKWFSSSKIVETQLAYWLKQLKDLPVLELPLDFQQPLVPTHQGKNHSFKISQQLTRKLIQLSKETSTTLFVTLLTGFAIILSRYSQQNDFAIGTPNASRHYPGINNMLGFFINLLILRCKFSKDMDVACAIKQHHKVLTEAFSNQDIPFERIVEELHPSREATTNPLCSTLFVFQNYAHQPLSLENMKIERVFSDNNMVLFGDYGSSKFDLTFYLQETTEGLEGLVEYNTDLFSENTISRLVNHYQTLLNSIVVNPHQPVNSISFLSSKEKENLLFKWNNKYQILPEINTLPQLFEQQALKTPNNIAVMFKQERLTYMELHHKTNQLANYLIQQGLQEEDLVVVCFDRGINMLISVLSILKSGGTYIPISPEYPKDKVQQLLLESKASFVLTQTKSKPTFTKIDSNTLNVIDITQLKYDEIPSSTINHSNSKSLAYVIYTSGTSGKPKGVAIEHKALVSFLISIQKELCLTSRDVFPAITPFTFDISGLELFLPLIIGGTCIIADKNTSSDGKKLKLFLKNNPITIMQATPATWYLLINSGWRNTTCMKILVGGEALSHVLGKQLLDAAGPFWNLYGPTEATIWSTIQWVEEIDESTHSHIVPIGKPIANTRAYVLDKNLQIMPIGCPGELYLSGQGLARGYLHRKDLTSRSFICSSSPEFNNIVLYKTGDRVRWLDNGMLEYIERLDKQIKIRGYRIELSDIENIILSYPHVSQAVVVAHGNKMETKQLIAYIVMQFDEATEVSKSVLQTEQIEYWHTVYDETYRGAHVTEQTELNTAGWNSSYTGKPIPLKEMQEWVDITVKRIIALKPRRVLEVGCGTGMILFNLLPHSQFYCATDITTSAIEKLKQQLSNQYSQDDLQLHVRPAHIFNSNEVEFYDTVILNSVIQYFPSISYLISVLDRAIESVCQKGHVFIGDVRSFTHLEAFYASVQLTRAIDSIDFNTWKTLFNKQVEEEEELVISPNFFRLLAQNHPRISYVTVQLKKGESVNEITQFRYDVVLHIEQEKLPVNPEYWFDWQKEALSASEIKANLQNQEPSCFAVQNIPNPGLTEVREALEYGLNYPKRSVLNWFKSQKRKFNETTVLDNIWEMADSVPYDLEVYWSEKEPLKFISVIFRHHKKGYVFKKGRYSNKGKKLSMSEINSLANCPIKHKWQGIELSSLKNYIQSKLPSYMFPSSYIFVDKIPLTANGKTNYAALPCPSKNRIAHNLIAPRNETEVKILELWTQLLHIDRISIEDNFFEKGGHSLLVVQLINMLNKTFKIELSVKKIFEAPTIVKLSTVIQKEIADSISKQTRTTNNLSKKSCICLDTSGAFSPLFLIHPIGGSILCYGALVQKLHLNRPIYALQDPSLEIKQLMFLSIKEMAQYYLDEIISIQPNGPYYLGGYSMGGTVACEVAHQLQHRGENVAWLGLFDTWAFSADNQTLLDIARLRAKQQLSYYKENLQDFCKDSFFNSLYKHHAKILADYKLQPLNCSIYLFKASETIEYDDSTNYWKPYASLGYKVYIVSGSHNTILTAPHVDMLKEKIRQSIKLCLSKSVK